MSIWSSGNTERARSRELEPIGVLDIGSNSVRLVVYEGAVRAPTPLFNEKVLCGLGKSVATTGKLGAESVERAIAALNRFRAIARVLKVKNVRAIATAAVRDASNGRDFILRAQKAAGTEIHILTGEREAELAAEGILMGFGPVDAVAGDLGGGSLELIDINKTALKAATSLPLGGLRLIDVTADRIDKASEIVDASLAGVPWLGQGHTRAFYAVGGTWRAVARLHMDLKGYPLRVMHAYAISTREAIEFCEAIRKRKISVASEDSKSRRDTMPYGALVLERLLKRLQPSSTIFSVFGVREGLLHSLLPEHERAKDPLLTFCEDYARLRSRSVRHALELCTWTDNLFTDFSLTETAEERRLRHAACLMSDIGWRAHPDYRGEQSLNVIAHAGLTGVDHPGRVFLGLAVYFRHVGPTEEAQDDLSIRLKKLIDRNALRRARIVGAAVRTAHMLSVGMPGIIDEVPIRLERSQLVLTLPAVYSNLDGERLRRRFATLAELMGREAVIRTGG